MTYNWRSHVGIWTLVTDGFRERPCDELDPPWVRRAELHLDAGAIESRYAEIAFQLRQPLYLRRHRHRLGPPRWMKIEAVAVLCCAHSDLVAQRFALADLTRDERRGFGFVHPQKEFGGRHRGEHHRLLVAIDSAQLCDALVAKNGGKSALASAGYQRLQLRLTAKHRQLVYDDPNSAAVAGGVQQAANNEIEPEIRERERRRTGLVAHSHE